MKWREITQFSELLSSQSSANNLHKLNHKNQQQAEKTLSFTSKTQTILRQTWDSKFIFTKRSLICHLLGRNIKSPDQNGKKPPATIKGYLSFQNQKIVQMFVSKMIEKQIFVEKRIQTQGKRCKNVILPMSLKQFQLLKNSPLKQKLIIQIPLSVIMNQQVRQKSGEKKQSRFSQFLVKKNQNDKYQQDKNLNQIEHQQQGKKLQFSKQKQIVNNKFKFDSKKLIFPSQNNRLKDSSKVPFKVFGGFQHKNGDKNENIIPKAQKNSSQQLNYFFKSQEQKRKQFWERQNKDLFQQFGQVQDDPKVTGNNDKNISKQCVLQMMKEIKQKNKFKKLNIPNNFFKSSEKKCNYNISAFNFKNSQQNYINHQVDLNQNQFQRSKVQETQNNKANQVQNINNQHIQNNNQSKNQDKFKYSFHIQHQQNKIPQIKQTQFFNCRPIQQNKTSQQSKTITIQHNSFGNNFKFQNNQPNKRSSGSSNHSDSIRLKQYYDNGQIGKFWDQIFQNPKYNSNQTQKINRRSQNNRQSQCAQIPQESQNTQTMTVQKLSNKFQSNKFNNFANDEKEQNLNISYQQQNNSMTKTLFPHNLNHSFPQQANFQHSSQISNYKNKTEENNVIHPSFKKIRNNQKVNFTKNNFEQNFNPYLFPIDSDFSDSFDKTLTIPLSHQLKQKQNQNNVFNKNQCNFYEQYNSYAPYKLQIQYPPVNQQIERSSYTRTVGQRFSSNQFYYTPLRNQNQQFFQKKERQSNYGSNTITLIRPFEEEKYKSNNQIQKARKNITQNDYQEYKRYKSHNPIRQLQI